MALADYYLCDVCNTKVFYDYDVEYEFEDMPAYGVGDMACICKACSSQYEIKIVKKGSRYEL